MNKYLYILCLSLLMACSQKNKEQKQFSTPSEKIIIDCNYTFNEAITSSNAPLSVIQELVLLPVNYYSTDNKIHQGQILVNKAIEKDISDMFQFMLKKHFPIAHAIPMVKYNWSDDASMQDNNTSAFCYRNVGFSLHARGLAIDINPYFNPVRWKPGWNRIDKPLGAAYNPSVNGTFTADNAVVIEFEKHRFHWGGKFTAKYDYHHFEKAGYWKPREKSTDSIPKSPKGDFENVSTDTIE